MRVAKNQALLTQPGRRTPAMQVVGFLSPQLVHKSARLEATLAQELKEELFYFNRTNTPALRDFTGCDQLAAELSQLEWE